MEVGRVIRTPDQRPGSNVREPFRARDFAVGLEAFRRNESQPGNRGTTPVVHAASLAHAAKGDVSRRRL